MMLFSVAANSKSSFKSLSDWSAFYDQYAGLVRAILFRMSSPTEVDDLVQDCLIRIWKGIGTFRGESKIETWIRQVAIHTAYDFYRSKGRKLDQEEFDEQTTPSNEPQTQRDFALSGLIDEALGKLSAEHRAVLVLIVFEEQSMEEASAILNIPEGTAKSRFHYAKTKLKELLKRKGISHDDGSL